MPSLPAALGFFAGALGLTMPVALAQRASPSAQVAPSVRSAGAAQPARLDTATFAGGCFWCMVHPFDQLRGVAAVTSGYTGGTVADPTYQAVSSGRTGHAESVEVLYDPQQVAYGTLLDVFWHNIDPLDAGGQFCDRGPQYRAQIFYHGADQQRLADSSKAALEQSKRFAQPIVTQIRAASTFYPAEGYHQDYYKKNPIRYRFYRWNCGRDQRLKQLWGVTPH
jgi:peptide-methionine (S)-S-oxide reductase